ncbi:MAG: winged helix-turn-helix transcriptional regulator [Tissierella sp.]|nr:winged helix-turn-helix transcriptional regulator [Tissierella sp.]
MKFFSPTTELKELLLLQHIEKNPNTTQKEIARVIDGATSMVNVYIDNLEKKNYMLRDYKSAKMVDYNITLEGAKRKNFLLINYMRELLDLYQLAKENVERFLSGIEEKGFNNILIYGAGDVADTILGAIRDRNKDTLKVLAVIDDDESIQDKELLGFKIISRDDIYKYNHDAVVITSYAFEDEITNKLRELNYSEDKIIRFFS